MRMKSVVLACCLLASPGWLAAQSGEATQSDRISGSWAGYMARGETKVPIDVEMKFDGTAVTGTITGPPSPGTIKTGTFDPKTGALKFEVWVQAAGGNVVTFDGSSSRARRSDA